MFAYKFLTRKSCENVVGDGLPIKARSLISLRMGAGQGQYACMWQPNPGFETLNGAFPPTCGGPVTLLK
jgi:hypothetical protein